MRGAARNQLARIRPPTSRTTRRPPPKTITTSYCAGGASKPGNAESLRALIRPRDTITSATHRSASQDQAARRARDSKTRGPGLVHRL